MAIRTNSTPPVDCDVCGTEITETAGGFLRCETVDLHDGSPVKDVCAVCIGFPLVEIFPHIRDRKVGNKLRPGPPAPPAQVDLDEPTPTKSAG